ncbi:MAG: hypothetical protein H0X34_04770 [Chthoniobacterales bacterium]|nr:hypothetical protein [Chthoniobacterales bacterium]
MPATSYAAGFKFETPWTIRQTESHLVFGPLSRHLPFAYVYATLAGSVLVYLAATNSKDLLHTFFALIPIPFLLRLTRRQQAIFGRVITKWFFSTLAVMFAIMGIPLAASRHRPEGWPVFILGLVWFPLLSAFPSLTERQSYVTLARALFSIPVVIWFCKVATFT